MTVAIHPHCYESSVAGTNERAPTPWGRGSLTISGIRVPTLQGNEFLLQSNLETRMLA